LKRKNKLQNGLFFFLITTASHKVDPFSHLTKRRMAEQKVIAVGFFLCLGGEQPPSGRIALLKGKLEWNEVTV
jgi:hypothetical protein